MKLIALAFAAVMLASPAWARDGDQTIADYYQLRSTTPTPSTSPTQSSSLISPGPLRATTNSNRVALTWNNIQSETGYLIERRRHDVSQFSEIAKTTANLTSYTDILTTVDHFVYRVRAYRAESGVTYSPYSNTVISEAPCD